VSDRQDKQSKRIAVAKPGAESAAKAKPPATEKSAKGPATETIKGAKALPGDTGKVKTGAFPAPAGKTARIKRSVAAKAGKATTQKNKAIKSDPQELEAITPFDRGVSLGVKFAVLTAAVVGLFMGLQGSLTFSIAAREMDAQITEQGLSIVSTLEKTVDRGFWVHRPEAPEENAHPTPMGAPDEPTQQMIAEQIVVRLRKDWEQRLRDLVESSHGKILAVIVLEKSDGRQEALAQYPLTPIRVNQSQIDVPDAGEIKVFDGMLVDGEKRVRRFDKPIRLDLDKDDAIEGALAELTALGDPPQDADKAAPLVAKLKGLTGKADATGLPDFVAWRKQNPAPIRLLRAGVTPSVSVFVEASRLDTLKAALWQRIALVTTFGALAGIMLTVLIATVLTSPVRSLEKDLTVVAGGDLTHQAKVPSKDEIGALAHVFNIMIRNLRAAQNNAVEKKSFERELTICKEIQDKLLPERIPQIPGLDIHSHYNSAKEVGGDYYDFIVIDQTHLGIIVADVAGKGVPGAMVMTMARSLVRLASVRNVSPADTFKKVNRILAKDIRRGMFVTSAYMVLNVKTRKLKVASAGHNPVVLFRAATGEIELLKPAGIALGFDKGTIFDNNVKEVEVQLEKGDRIVTFTDGVNEAMDADGEEFGDDKFYALVKEHARKSSKAFVEAIVQALDEHRGDAEQSDDITITTLAVTDAAGTATAVVTGGDEAEGGEGA
jgi:serine phosphatase RsbU (regulator of sigma subunit)